MLGFYEITHINSLSFENSGDAGICAFKIWLGNKRVEETLTEMATTDKKKGKKLNEIKYRSLNYF